MLLIGCGGGDGEAEADPDTELRVRSETMLPTYAPGDLLQVDLEPESVTKEDVVIFHPPAGAPSVCGAMRSAAQACPRPTRRASKMRFVGRIVAKPGDSFKVIRGATYINGKRQEEPYAQLDERCATCNLPEEITIPAGHVFLMCDNRGVSADSREWGPIPSRWVLGKVIGVKRVADEGPGIE